jgi:hypothetical protein
MRSASCLCAHTSMARTKKERGMRKLCVCRYFSLPMSASRSTLAGARRLASTSLTVWISASVCLFTPPTRSIVSMSSSAPIAAWVVGAGSRLPLWDLAAAFLLLPEAMLVFALTLVDSALSIVGVGPASPSPSPCDRVLGLCRHTLALALAVAATARRNNIGNSTQA